ncbi:MAG: hypothetical protein P4M11_10665 [Candidatus Pacebacteria bacterium]|nr:hypothetical protein [Candidatus Paceibacterota bacterium]
MNENTSEKTQEDIARFWLNMSPECLHTIFGDKRTELYAKYSFISKQHPRFYLDLLVKLLKSDDQMIELAFFCHILDRLAGVMESPREEHILNHYKVLRAIMCSRPAYLQQVLENKRMLKAIEQALGRGGPNETSDRQSLVKTILKSCRIATATQLYEMLQSRLLDFALSAIDSRMYMNLEKYIGFVMEKMHKIPHDESLQLLLFKVKMLLQSPSRPHPPHRFRRLI